MAMEEDDEGALAALMGFSSFDSTKGKKVEGNDVGMATVAVKRKYRQYMNRRGGFNRPLDAVHWRYLVRSMSVNAIKCDGVMSPSVQVLAVNNCQERLCDSIHERQCIQMRSNLSTIWTSVCGNSLAPFLASVSRCFGRASVDSVLWKWTFKRAVSMCLNGLLFSFLVKLG